MKRSLISFISVLFILSIGCSRQQTVTDIPLPEHPRPDFERNEWLNLNGTWAFTFNDILARQALAANSTDSLDLQIKVPFPWGSKLSGVDNRSDSAWYGRSITIPKSWKGKRVFLIIGASDWETKAWIDGKYLGKHQGGYTPFEFELTDNITFGKPQQICIAVEDKPSGNRLYGKQGYGNARGIWQTVYMEARGNNYIKEVHFTPDVDNSKVDVNVVLKEPAVKSDRIRITFKNREQNEFVYHAVTLSDKQHFDIALNDQHLWNIDDPYLYEVKVSLVNKGKIVDEVNSYFGQRKISVIPLPGLNYPYVALNNKPVYLQLCLDQSYHPDGFYTFPNDEFIKNEIMLSKRLGLNGNRIHIKVEVPRKLYWADKLGLLIMADTPNFGGEPTDEAKKDWEYCLRHQIARDYNHPCIFSWVNFNESWGLLSRDHRGNNVYKPETQKWVRDMFTLTKSLDQSRLAEDNSACRFDHVITDLNTWHGYHPGYEWEHIIAGYDSMTYEGSSWNFIGGNKQGRQPMLNSECGNVWGYAGSAGDCDFSWDYHIMINSFRRHPKVAGWLYTEHHDVINEWNGYVKYDRTQKIDGMNELVPGMSIADFSSLYYISPNIDLCSDVSAGSSVEIPLTASFMTDKNPGKLTLNTKLTGVNDLGKKINGPTQQISVPFKEYLNETIGTITVDIPEYNGLYLLQMILKDERETVLHRNFVTFVVKDGLTSANEKNILITFKPSSYKKQKWTEKQWNILDGLKVNGAGTGFFEYDIPWPQGLKKEDIDSVTLSFEASSKQLFGKDIDDNTSPSGDYMLGEGTKDHCKSSNAYAMTDNNKWESKVCITVNDAVAGSFILEDDPADHRGILSWHAQLKDYYLREAGSYGYLIETGIPLNAIEEEKSIRIRLTVPESANRGMALYGRDFGRYPLDPTIVFHLK